MKPEDAWAADQTIRAAGTDDVHTEALAGKVGYIDPVCLAEGAPATASSDLYALGASAWLDVLVERPTPPTRCR